MNDATATNSQTFIMRLLKFDSSRRAYGITGVGMSCNLGARIVGNMFEAEKVLGMIHISLGTTAP